MYSDRSAVVITLTFLKLRALGSVCVNRVGLTNRMLMNLICVDQRADPGITHLLGRKRERPVPLPGNPKRCHDAQTAKSRMFTFLLNSGLLLVN